MPSLEVIKDPEPSADNNSNSSAAPIPAPGPEPITFQLSRKKGEAVFREPTVRECKSAEGATQVFTAAGAITRTGCKELAKFCLVSWGGASELPPDNQLRAADMDKLISAFSERFDNAYKSAEAAGFEAVEEGDDLFHKFKLIDGTVVVFKDLTEEVQERIQKFSNLGIIETNCRAFAALCVRWGSETQITSAKLYPLSLEDYCRAQIALNAFRQ